MRVIAAQEMIESLQAFIACEEMDNVARYLQAGRRLVGLCDAGLKWTWADARRDYLDGCGIDPWNDYIDAEAELTLRRLPRPEHLIEPEERKRIAARIRQTARHPEANQQLREDFLGFVQRWAARRN